MSNIQCHGPVQADGLHVVQELVASGACGAARYDSETGSTNSIAMAALQQAKCDLTRLPMLYLADRQTSGRGRMGRTWISDDATLTFSLVVSNAAFYANSHLLSLAVGVGVARSIDHSFAPYRASLKWPNDIYLGGSKVAGILVEATQAVSQARVVGIGINVSSSPDLSQSPDAPPVTDVATAVGRPVDRYTLLEPVVRSVVESVDALSDDAASVVDEFRSRCLLTGNRIRLVIGENLETGLCRGVNEEGELQIQSGQITKAYRSGEASFIRKSAEGY
tara:strand:+ start:211898 stop:212731 length:834 start_codon:yes stop_codon:yes gene_type:complete